MATHSCHRCFQQVPEDAARCPNCGNPQVRVHRKPILIAVASGVLLALVVLVIFVISHSGEAPPEQPTSPFVSK